jgi:ABC-type cobalamin transport system permease subunit
MFPYTLVAVYPEKLNATNVVGILAAVLLGVILYSIGRREPQRRRLVQFGLGLVVIGVALFAWLWVPRNL